MSLQGIIRPPVGFLFVGSHKNHSSPHAVIGGGGAEFIIPFVNRVAPPIADSDGFMYTFYCDLEKVMMST